MTYKNLIILSSPSGAGDDTIIAELKKTIPIEVIITTTSRPMRINESQKNPYYFISKQEFEQKIENNDFIEYAQHYNDQFYGVTKQEIERVTNSDKISIWKIDYQGTIKAKQLFSEIKAIMLYAPLHVLEKRIRKRENVTDEYVRERMQYTKKFFKHKHIFDYQIHNEQGKLDQAVEQVKKIIEKETKKTPNL